MLPPDMAGWTLIIFSSFTKMSCYQNVLLPKCLVAEMSYYQNVPFTEMSFYRNVHYQSVLYQNVLYQNVMDPV